MNNNNGALDFFTEKHNYLPISPPSGGASSLKSSVHYICLLANTRDRFDTTL